jgi:hypothetical protein
MKIGDLVTFTPESWGTPIEDRPLYIVVREPYEISTAMGSLVDIVIPGSSDIYATGPESLELLSESR